MKIDDLVFVEHSDDNYRIYKCPLCGGTIKVHDSVFYGRCDTCLATLIDYKPAPHQVKFHQSKAKFKLNIGGFGSGKTTMGACEIANHAMAIANGRTLITAQSLQQVKEAVLPELEKFLPPWFIARQTKTPLPKYTLINGHEIVIYASNDEEKLRSLNLTAFWIIEASGVAYSIFTQLTARLRNRAAVVKDKEGREVEHNFLGIVESNPEEGWIRDEFLLRADKIFASKSVDTSSYDKLKVKKPEKSYHAFLSASPDNTYLHKTFISDMCVGKDDRWIAKYIYCRLEVKEGAVYPDFMSCLVDPFPIPEDWQRIFGFDKGWSDQTCLCCGALDVKNGICYIYDEYYVSEKPVTYHARRIKELVMGHKLYKNIIADPSVRARNDRDGVSYRDYFYNVSGLWLEEGNNAIFDGIERVRDFMYQGKLKVFTNCVNLKSEAQNYLWKKDKYGIMKDQPTEKNNHLMDALRYLVMALPFDIRECALTKTPDSNKMTILDRLKLHSNDSEEDGEGGVYGIGYYDL